MVITVGGMIGLGKTTATEILSDALGSKPFYESVKGNKILPLFYTSSKEEQERRRYPFLLQLWFLNTRFSSIKEALADNNNVLDRSIYEDVYFATKNMELGRISPLEMEIYQNLFDNMMEEIKGMPKKAPDLMIYLHGSFDTVIKRIRRRGRDYELAPDLLSYYRFLWEGYDAWMEKSYKASDVLSVNVDTTDFKNNPQDKAELIKEVKDRLRQIRAAKA